ncbi:cell division protein FtsA [Rhodobium orientis]|uniref:Cell division protein FtsA n=1 Tax=Rhodobium orientis TaxID=34017 RepID=A0A327JGM3_9HYPH|nr:cell division protein FtsA [Rhodobium orientis]MBB4305456.1 cell division protein FtsA [Rhodobium orientis]MBK5948652.1 cell division protein FtsA [Rhodobium orientis]RAI25275.1 cell division protein FtsA [Rhodobium orientis]
MSGIVSETRVPRMRPLTTRRPSIVSVLDVGSTKICCLVAKLKPREADKLLPGRTHTIEVIGFGHQRSRGVKSGVVVDLDAAEQAIRMVVDSAERMAGVTIESLIVNVSCGRLGSEAFSANVLIDGEEVRRSDIQRVLEAGSLHTAHDGRIVVHSLPIGYALDGNRGIDDPCGMIGKRLGVDMHVVTADAAPVRNLELSVNRSHLDVETMVATPYASGLSTLAEDEAELGVAAVDIGGGTTSIAVFAGGQVVHVDAVPLGGHHITTDLARGLSTRLQDAERLKTLHGSAIGTAADERRVLTIPPVGEDDGDAATQVPRALLSQIIGPRIEEILEMVRDRLNQSGFAGRIGKRVVLTGGSSQLTGLPEVARRILGRNVRLGRPLGVAGLPEAARGASFASAVGLLIYPQVAQIEQFEVRSARQKMTGTGGYFSRFGNWIRESF